MAVTTVVRSYAPVFAPVPACHYISSGVAEALLRLVSTSDFQERCKLRSLLTVLTRDYSWTRVRQVRDNLPCQLCFMNAHLSPV
jgi:hypothetical protein